MDNKTVFVVGAGASKEFNLPTGDELRDLIAETVNPPKAQNGYSFGTNEYADILRHKVTNLQHRQRGFDASGMYQAMTKRRSEIVAALPYAPSIDNFLHLHREDPLLIELGKLAIADVILRKEYESTLTDQPTFVAKKSTESWLNELGRWLFPLHSYSDLPQRLAKIAFVTFNYDRCIEQFFAYAIASLYRRPLPEAKALAATIDIYHPYGHLGNLPLNEEFGEGICAFGRRTSPNAMLDIQKRIKTFTESVDEGDALEEAREKLRLAKQIIFLGFAFHDLNLDLLFPKGPKYNGNTFLSGTMYRMSDSEATIIRNRLHMTYRPMSPLPVNDKYYDIKCGEFMRKEGREIFSRL